MEKPMYVVSRTVVNDEQTRDMVYKLLKVEIEAVAREALKESELWDSGWRPGDIRVWNSSSGSDGVSRVSRRYLLKVLSEDMLEILGTSR
ncbi:MAG: hypothetical protein OXG49_10090 [Chloroflexi bacterium]|nr:hypothetical protein [Chloroflexota bacterium]